MTISIIIPTYNREELLKRTVTSILRQTYGDFECLVVDDFSTDNTKDMVMAIAQLDNRVKYILNERKKGPQGARNTGLTHARGVYINLFDSDDMMFPQCLEKKIECYQSDPSLDVVTSFAHVLDNNEKLITTFCPITEGHVHKQVLSGDVYVDTNSSMFKASLLKDVGFLDEDCPSYQEWDLHIMLSKVAKYGFVPEFLTGYYFQHSATTISSDKKRDLLGRLFIYSKHKNDFIESVGVNFYQKQCASLFNECRLLNIDPRKHMIWGSVEEKIMTNYRRKIIFEAVIKKVRLFFNF